MYLDARRYVSKYDYSEGYENKKIVNDYAVISALAPAESDKYADFGGIQVSYPVGYWRKANAIHGWIIDNCADGVDECQEIHLSREQLAQLRDLAMQAIREPAMAGDVLPPTQGFFFGSYEIDEWYMEDMKHTVEMLDHVLRVIPDDSWEWSFVYRASW